MMATPRIYGTADVMWLCTCPLLSVVMGDILYLHQVNLICDFSKLCQSSQLNRLSVCVVVKPYHLP